MSCSLDAVMVRSSNSDLILTLVLFTAIFHFGSSAIAKLLSSEAEDTKNGSVSVGSISEKRMDYETFSRRYPTDEVSHSRPTADPRVTKPTTTPSTEMTTKSSTELTTRIVTITSTSMSHRKIHPWERVLQTVHIVMSLIGYVANNITLLALTKHGEKFHASIRLLLRHQSFVDSCVCAMATILALEPILWVTGVGFIDMLVCHVWHSERPYWLAVFVSIMNLIAIAVERYLVVCRPFKHADLTPLKVRKVILSMYGLAVLVTAPPLFLLFMREGKCVSESKTSGSVDFTAKLFPFIGVMTLFAFYILPVCAFAFLYGSVIRTVYQKSRQKKQSSNVLAQSQNRITNAAFTLTILFVLTIGMDLWGFALDMTQVVIYRVGVAVQKIGVFFCLLNSVINPFIYYMFMPPFRLAVRKTLMVCFQASATVNPDVEVPAVADELKKGATLMVNVNTAIAETATGPSK